MDISWVELIGYGGTLATVVTYSMRNIVTLRIAGILSSIFFISYALIVGVWPMLVTELVILPINCWRLYQIVHPSPKSPDTEPLTA
jgi:CRP/FNR family cyclic AMP-dependent transcriptional regulator